VTILQSVLKSEALRRTAVILLFAGVTPLPATAQVGLPRIAIGVPADQPIAAGLQSAEQCGIKNKLIVLPPISLQFTTDEGAGSSPVDQSQAIQSVPQDPTLWLHVIVGADSVSGSETEKQITDRVDASLKSLPLASPNVRGLIVEVNEPQTSFDLYAFALLRLALVAKSSNTSLRLAFVFQPGFIDNHQEIVKRLAIYADLLGTTDAPGWQKDAAWIAEQALNKPVILKLAPDALATETSLLTAELAAAGTSVEILWAEPADNPAANRVCAVNSFITYAIPSNMLQLDSDAVPFKLTADGMGSDDVRWFGSGQSPDMVAVAHVKGTPGEPKMISLQSAGSENFNIQWYDPATGAQLPADKPVTSDYVLISISKPSEADTAAYSAVNVKASFGLSVEEVVARWQQYREAQKLKLENYQSSSFMKLHFESTNLVSAFDISIEFKQFFDRAGKMEFAQTAFYVNGVKFSNKHEFPLPQLEPEKVLTQPLELKLNERYVYKLLGTEQVDGIRCYVVGVEPKILDEALYSGKVWIDGTTFREVKQTLSQRGVKSNVVVNVETQEFELVSDGKGNQYNLPRSISAQQTLNAAGRDFLLQRSMQFSEYAINTPQFAGALEAEHDSDDPMYRDTDHGLRVLKKQGSERVVQENSTTRIRSLVSGAMYEGTFNFPIPFLGISIADFDYRHTGAQLSTFFAGPILATDLSKQYRTKYRLAAELALSALPGENRVYTGDTEDTGAEVLSWGEDTGVRATWQATHHLSFTASSYLEYDFYHSTSDTSSQYAVPRSGIAFLPQAQARFTEKGYVFTADGTRGQRIAWRQFGCPASSQQTNGCSPVQALESGYTLYDADLNKDYYFRKFTEGGWDISYYGGNQLDRFSRYFPSPFSQPNIHGIPSGTDSFDAIAMGNVHYGFNAMNLIKFEGLYSYARARNLDESRQFRLFDGLETNFNTAGPWGTLIQGTVSYALDGNIARYNSRWGAIILILKPLH